MAKVQYGAALRPLRVLFNAGPVSGLSDGRLLERFMGSDSEAAELAFAAIVDRHGPMVRRICRQMLGNLHDAQDAFQATFFILARKAHAIHTRDSVASWLHGVAYRVCSPRLGRPHPDVGCTNVWLQPWREPAPRRSTLVRTRIGGNCSTRSCGRSCSSGSGRAGFCSATWKHVAYEGGSPASRLSGGDCQELPKLRAAPARLRVRPRHAARARPVGGDTCGASRQSLSPVDAQRRDGTRGDPTNDARAIGR